MGIKFTDEGSSGNLKMLEIYDNIKENYYVFVQLQHALTTTAQNGIDSGMQ